MTDILPSNVENSGINERGKGGEEGEFLSSLSREFVLNLTRTKHLIVDLRKRLDNRVEHLVIVLINMGVVRALSCCCA